MLSGNYGLSTLFCLGQGDCGRVKSRWSSPVICSAGRCKYKITVVRVAGDIVPSFAVSSAWRVDARIASDCPVLAS